jgi:hypothetical protein
MIGIEAICNNNAMEMYPYEVLFEDGEIVKVPLSHFMQGKYWLDPISVRAMVVSYAREHKVKDKR